MPTKKQIEVFWIGYGFKREKIGVTSEPDKPRHWAWLYPQGIYMRQLPPIDLNNLFKYAVPKVANYNLCRAREPMTSNFGTHYAQVWGKLSAASYGEAYDKDPAEALYQALDKVRSK